MYGQDHRDAEQDDHQQRAEDATTRHDPRHEAIDAGGLGPDQPHADHSDGGEDDEANLARHASAEQSDDGNRDCALERKTVRGAQNDNAIYAGIAGGGTRAYAVALEDVFGEVEWLALGLSDLLRRRIVGEWLGVVRQRQDLEHVRDANTEARFACLQRPRSQPLRAGADFAPRDSLFDRRHWMGVYRPAGTGEQNRTG